MEDDQPSTVLGRLKDPLVWARLESGYRIEDLQEKRFEEALQFMKEYFVTEELLCRSSEMPLDEASLENFVNTATFWMKDTTSMIAVEEGTNTVVGVLINRVVERLERTRTFSRIRLMDNVGVAYDKVMTLRWQVHRRLDVFEHYGVDKFFRFYALGVHPHHRGKGVGMGLLNCGIQLAESMDMPVAMGLFTSARSQALAFKLGMEVLFELDYNNWRAKNDEMIFDNPGVGNYSIMMMGMIIRGNHPKPLSIYPPME